MRKLQFLLASALEQDCDSIVTVGGDQSNHVRATAIAARSLGLKPHIILRTDTPAEQLGYNGNLLLNRLVGSQIWLSTKKEWRDLGSEVLVTKVADELRRSGKRP